MSNQKYFWHGEPVKTELGAVYVLENTEKPLYWYNYECNWDIDQDKAIHGDKAAMIPAIRVTSKDGYSFIISNHFGIGINKLLKGGWPNQSHFSFNDDVKFETLEELGSLRIAYSIRKFDEEAFSAHESKRKLWQKKNHPEAYKERELLMESFKSNQRTIIHNFNPKYGNPQGEPEETK